jgi:hypothetical protein
MGDIVPFIARVRDTGDWSPGERARLEEFGERLAASGAKIEIIFGTTDEGDPWCVVKDQNEDILVHVARIGGRFVVYSAIEDAVAEDSNLHEALRDRLAGAVEIPTAQVLSFGLPREAQTFIALLVATAFFYETTGLEVGFDPPATPVELEPEEEPLPPATVDEGHVQDRDVAMQGAVFAETVMPDLIGRQLLAMATEEALGDDLPPPASPKDQPQVMPIETGARQPSAAMLAHSETRDAGERLSGEHSGERLAGGAGADTLRGRALDTLQGGAGDDRLELAGATAIGGEGADTFVILNPTAYGRADTLLGVIEDFSASEGDRVTTEGGMDVSLMPPTLAPGGGNDRGTGTGDTDKSLVTDGFTRVEVDLNGDGVMDGYILVRTRGAPEEGAEAPAKPHHEEFAEMAMMGRNLSGAEDPWTP